VTLCTGPSVVRPSLRVMFMLHGRLAAKPGQRDELLAILSEVGRGEPMPGCRLYLVAVDATDVDGVWVTEVWESEDAHRASLQLDGIRQQVARATPLLDTAGFRRQELDARAGIPG
jgi:quinol monooxygenase YgiN